jgi:hypothetical protein
MTPEHVRIHAAGHLAAAARLARVGLDHAARVVLTDVRAYMTDPKVKCPPHMIAVIDGAIATPSTKMGDIAGLERIFMDPLNTTIEEGNGGFGS